MNSADRSDEGFLERCEAELVVWSRKPIFADYQMLTLADIQ